MENEMNSKEEQAKKIVEAMQQDNYLSKIEEMIRDNKITFIHKDKEYRIRLLNLREKDELDELRRKKFGQLIQDKDILLEKDLREILKNREIDIDKIDEDIKKLEIEELDLQLKLGESISKNENETILKSYEERINDMRNKVSILSSQKTLLLQYSLENQLLNFVAMTITYLSLDILTENGIYIRMFKTLEDFKNYEDETLINKAGEYSMFLQYM